MMIDCKFFEAFGDRVGLDEFFQVFQFFCFYGFSCIVARRYGLSQVQASSDRGDADDDDQEGHDGRYDEEKPFLFGQIDVEHVEVIGPEDDNSQENPGDNRDPSEAGFTHGADDNCRDSQGDDGQQLVGYPEDRPDSRQVPLKDDVPPCAGNQSRSDDSARQPVGIAELRPYAANEFLEHVTANTGTRIDDGHDEQGFKHDAEVIPVVHEVVEARDVGEDEGHADSQGNGTARTMGDVFTDHGIQLGQVDDLDAQGLEMFSRRVDSEIVVRYERAGCDQSHHADEGFRQHSAVANRQDGAFVHEHLRRRAGRNHAVEAGNSTAGDGDEDIRQDRAGDDRAAASAELGDSRHLDCRADDDDADGQGADGTNLHVCRKIITGSQEQPYRKGGSYEAVNDEGDGNAFGADRKQRCQRRRSLDGRAKDDGQQSQGDTDDGAFFNAARTQELHVEADEDGDRDGHADGEGPPGAVVQGVDDDDGHTGHSQDVEEQDGKGR